MKTQKTSSTESFHETLIAADCYADQEPAAKGAAGHGRDARLSLARVLACFAIVTLHTVFAANEYFIDTLTQSEDLASRFVENNMMWAVPVFLMVTGVLQLDPRRELTWRKLYRKYIFRVACALVVFSLLFRLFDIIMDAETFSISGLLGVAFTEMMTGRGWGHLWYLYLLIGLYILLPFFRIVVRYCTDTDLKYLWCVYFVFTSLIPVIEGFGINIAFYISESLIYPLYLLTGYMLKEGKLRISRGVAAALVLGSVAAIGVLDIMKYGKGIDVPGVLFGYSSPLVIAQAAGAFALIIGMSGLQPDPAQAAVGSRFTSAVCRLDSLTFGVYLISMAFVRLIFKYAGLNPYSGPAIILLAVSVAGIFAVSCLVTAILKRIPGMRAIL